MMKKLLLTLFFISAFTYGCNNSEESYYETTLSPENQRILEEFREILKKNQLKADSISSIYNLDYNYTIPIKAYLDLPYRFKRDYNYFDIELFIADVPYYGMCNSDSTKGFIFSLHFPNKLIDITLYPTYNKKYIGFGRSWYNYNVKF